MNSYQKLKLENQKLRGELKIFKDALTYHTERKPQSLVNSKTLQSGDTFLDIQHFINEVCVIRQKKLDRKLKKELQLWVVNNLDEEEVLKLLAMKKERKY